MKVRATATGYYGILRVPGTDSAEFDVPEGSTATWFEPVNKRKKAKEVGEENAASAEFDYSGIDPRLI